jgi:murein DD-endopeptidase MepM/ murein hydrolase activator NlpD
VVIEPVDWPTQYLELKDKSKVNLNEQDLARVIKENGCIGRLWPISSPVIWQGSFLQPFTNFRPEGDGRFGHRRFINGEPRNPHSGADYSGARGKPVLATNSGRVVMIMDHFFSGNSVFIDHGLGVYSMYFHLHRVAVSEGQTVTKGEKIGTVGSSGRATGPHLHIGYRINGARVDPRSLIKLELD